MPNKVLPRFKPDPIPAIKPVPEVMAEGALLRVYEETKVGLGVPWMGVVAMSFAQYPKFYQHLWSALEPIALSSAFGDACAVLRQTAEAQANELGPTTIVPRLGALGYTSRDLAEINDCVEIFDGGNMPYLLMAALARLLLEGHHWTGVGQVGSVSAPVQPPSRPVLMEEHHADPTLGAVYGDIKKVLGLPFVNTDYRALARWPSYFTLAWQELRPAIADPRYEGAVTAVHQRCVDLARDLPNATGLTPGALREAAEQDAVRGEVLSVVQLFQWLLPGLAVNVSFLKAQVSDHT